MFLHPFWLWLAPLAVAPWLWLWIRRSAGETAVMPTLFFLRNDADRASRRRWPPWVEALLESLLILTILIAAAEPGGAPATLGVHHWYIFVDNSPSLFAARGPRTTRSEMLKRLRELRAVVPAEWTLFDWEDVELGTLPPGLSTESDFEGFLQHQKVTSTEADPRNLLAYFNRHADFFFSASARTLLFTDERFLRLAPRLDWPRRLEVPDFSPQESLTWLTLDDDSPRSLFEGGTVHPRVRLCHEGSAVEGDLRLVDDLGQMRFTEAVRLRGDTSREFEVPLDWTSPGWHGIEAGWAEGADVPMRRWAVWRVFAPWRIALDGGPSEVEAVRTLLAADLAAGHIALDEAAPLRIALDPERARPGRATLIFLPNRIQADRLAGHLLRLGAGRWPVSPPPEPSTVFFSDRGAPDFLKSLAQLAPSTWRPKAGQKLSEAPSLWADRGGQPILWRAGDHLVAGLDPDAGSGTLRHAAAIGFLTECLAELAGSLGAKQDSTPGAVWRGQNGEGLYTNGAGFCTVRQRPLDRWMDVGAEKKRRPEGPRPTAANLANTGGASWSGWGTIALAAWTLGLLATLVLARRPRRV